MQSSTLYGSVTKVTAGKYFVQVANKGVDKTKEKSSEVKDRGKEKQVRIKEKEESEKKKKMKELVEKKEGFGIRRMEKTQ